MKRKTRTWGISLKDHRLRSVTEKCCLPVSKQRMLHLSTTRATQTVSPEGIQDEKAQDTDPRYQRNDFSESRLWYLPIQRKAKFLNLRYLVFFN